jgi:hypothetical protein
MATSDIQTGLVKAVTKAVDVLYTAVVQRLGGGNYPKELKNGVSTKSVEQTGEVLTGAVVVEGETVLAYEFGSGIWSEIGPQVKYPIFPKNASMLAFDWPAATEAAAFSDTGDELVTPGPGGRVILPGVMHPGIRSQPFVRPSIDETADKIVELIGDEFLISLSKSLGPDVVVI